MVSVLRMIPGVMLTVNIGCSIICIIGCLFFVWEIVTSLQLSMRGSVILTLDICFKYCTLWQDFRKLKVAVLLEIVFCCFSYGTVW